MLSSEFTSETKDFNETLVLIYDKYLLSYLQPTQLRNKNKQKSQTKQL